MARAALDDARDGNGRGRLDGDAGELLLALALERGLVLRVAPASENFAPPRRARAREDVREELRRADALSLAVHESAKASQHTAILLIVLYKVDKQTQHRRGAVHVALVPAGAACTNVPAGQQRPSQRLHALARARAAAPQCVLVGQIREHLERRMPALAAHLRRPRASTGCDYVHQSTDKGFANAHLHHEEALLVGRAQEGDCLHGEQASKGNFGHLAAVLALALSGAAIVAAGTFARSSATTARHVRRVLPHALGRLLQCPREGDVLFQPARSPPHRLRHRRRELQRQRRQRASGHVAHTELPSSALLAENLLDGRHRAARKLVDRRRCRLRLKRVRQQGQQRRVLGRVAGELRRRQAASMRTLLGAVSFQCRHDGGLLCEQRENANSRDRARRVRVAEKRERASRPERLPRLAMRLQQGAARPLRQEFAHSRGGAAPQPVVRSLPEAIYDVFKVIELPKLLAAGLRLDECRSHDRGPAEPDALACGGADAPARISSPPPAIDERASEAPG
mmetsp:Transcript_8570/g.34885  ORF Transcript_8570/g.34885 Transcript_8570/m.34885 type:complete len:513 (-) Transcript_8570:118-1656(-)